MLSDDDTNDEIEKIKQAMRISKARQHACTRNLSLSSPSSADQPESSVFNRKQNDHIIKLETQLMSREEEVKYLKNKLGKKEQSLEESKKLLELKTKAIEDEVRQSFVESHATLMHKYRVIEQSTSRLLPLITAVERSTMHGRHMVPTETNMSMIVKLKEGIQHIASAVSDASSLQIVRSSSNSKENQASLDNECSQHLDTTLLDICRTLEDENASLRQALAAGEEKWSRAQEKASKSSLIPQYRAAIVKEKSLNACLEGDVERLQARCKELSAELEAVREDREADTTEKSKLKGLLIQAREERDKYKSTINEMLQHESKEALAREYSLLASQYSTNNPQLSAAGTSCANKYSGLNHTSSATTQQSSSCARGVTFRSGETASSAQHSGVPIRHVYGDYQERIVERDLKLLDGEIGDLRRRLEVAAVKQTKSIVSEVMEQATVARDMSQQYL